MKKSRKLVTILMTAIIAASSPATAAFGPMMAFADTDKSKNYDICDASWDVSDDTDGKSRVFATWESSDDKAKATVTIYRNDKTTGIKVNTYTSSGSVDVTSELKKLGKTGDFTFKIKAGKKSKDEDGNEAAEYSEAESDTLEIDSDLLRSMKKVSQKKTTAVSTSVSTSNSNLPGAPQQNTPNNATNGSTEPGDFLTNGTWADWGIGWVYLVNNTPVRSKWVFDSAGKLYHIGENGFMDVNRSVSDYTGTHYLDANGVLIQ